MPSSLFFQLTNDLLFAVDTSKETICSAEKPDGVRVSMSVMAEWTTGVFSLFAAIGCVSHLERKDENLFPPTYVVLPGGLSLQVPRSLHFC
jgi:hypothetical protein